MYTKEELKNSLSNIIDLSSEDPEDIYVAKWKIESELKKKDPSYTKKTLSRFISDLHLGTYIFVYDGSSVPFCSYEGFMFVASGIQKGIELLKDTVENLDYDLTKLNKFNPVDLMSGKTYGSNYFLIDGNVMTLP